MIEEYSDGKTNQTLKKPFRRIGPLDAYIYKERCDEEDMKETQENMGVHLEGTKEKTIHIFTDGACTNNGRPSANAAWGVLLVSDLGYIVLDRFSGAVPISEPQTNQRAELRALLQGITVAETQIKNDPSIKRVQVWSDSQYSIHCASVWGPKWKSNGWKKPGGPIQHLDLIELLVLGTQRLGMTLEYKWLKGHKGGESQYAFPWVFNHQVDALATGALR